jgi:hypothetical protein
VRDPQLCLPSPLTRGAESVCLVFLVVLSARNNLFEKFLRSLTFMRALSPALGETSKVGCDCRSRKEEVVERRACDRR